MADKFPLNIRTDSPSLTTIIVRGDTTVKCGAHADGSVVEVTMAGGPPSPGNGHPGQGAAAENGRCTTCDREFLRIANLGTGGLYSWSQVSQRKDFAWANDYGEDTYLDDQNPTTNYGTSFNVYITEVKAAPNTFKHAIVEFRPLALPERTRIIKAEMWVSVSSISEGGIYDAYVLLRNDTVITQATWNIYKTGSNWTVPGALGDDTDRDTNKRFASARPIGGTGWQVLVDGEDFSKEVNARWGGNWFMGFYPIGVPTVKNEAVWVARQGLMNRPYLRVWYESDREGAGFPE